MRILRAGRQPLRSRTGSAAACSPSSLMSAAAAAGSPAASGATASAARTPEANVVSDATAAASSSRRGSNRIKLKHAAMSVGLGFSITGVSRQIKVQARLRVDSGRRRPAHSLSMQHRFVTAAGEAPLCNIKSIQLLLSLAVAGIVAGAAKQVQWADSNNEG